jgi:hypothetical protein
MLIVGIVFLQPDVLDPSRVKEEDFGIKVGYVVILLEFRVQQSPKTHMYLLHV